MAYARGWFDAQGRLELRMKDAYVDMITNQSAAEAEAEGAASEAFLARLDEVRDLLSTPVFVDVDVSHGLVLLLQGMRPGLAGAVMTLDDDTVASVEAAKFVDGIEMRAHIGFDQIVHYEGSVPALRIDEADGTHTRFLGAEVDGEYVLATGVLTFAGEAPFFMATFAEDEALEIRGLRTSGEYRQFEGGLWLGDAQATIDTITSNLPDGDGVVVALNLERFSLSGGLTLDEQDDQLLKATVRYGADRLTMDEVSASFDVPMSVDGVSREAMVDFLALNSDPEYLRFMADPEGSVPIPDELTAFLEKMIAQPPSVRIGPAEVTYDDAPVNFDLHASLASAVLRDTGFAGLADPAIATQAAIVKADATVPAALAEQIAELVLADQIGASFGPSTMSPEQIAQLAAAQAPAMLEQLVQQGMIQREGDRYRAKVSVENGNLDLNGLVLPLGMFQ
ncbi:MAG: DUF945 family protein, partial [Pseudomonadota bacterium]